MPSTLYLDKQSKPFLNFKPGQKLVFTVEGTLQSVTKRKKTPADKDAKNELVAPSESSDSSAEIYIDKIMSVKAGSSMSDEQDEDMDIEQEISEAKRNTPAKLAEEADEESY
jgi:hypothetical protein